MTEIDKREIAEQLITDAIEDIEFLTISEQLDDYGLSPEDAERTAKEIAPTRSTCSTTPRN